VDTAPVIPGSIVRLRGELWRVRRADPFAACMLLTLDGHGPANAGRCWRAVTPFDRPVVPCPGRPRRRRRDTVLRIARAAIADSRPATGLWCAAAARLDVLPYQLEPALAVLDGATRVLLADAVGLGKTVQAGLILAELHARGLVERALVLVPAGLRAQWADELRDRFGLAPAVLDQAEIARGMAALPRGKNPWAAPAVVVASIDLVKRPEVLGAVEAAPIDLVIVDEAHHLTPASDRGAAVARLAARTPWVVLASATPHSGDEGAFRFLTGLGAHDDPIAVFRRSRGVMEPTRARREHLVTVRPSSDEAALVALSEAYARALWRARGAVDPAVRLVAMTIARRAASSPEALLRTLDRRRALLAGGADPSPRQEALPWAESDESDADLAAGALAAPGLADPHDERHWLERLIGAAHAVGNRGSKARWLARFLGRTHEPVLIFTEFRDTIDAVASACPSRCQVATLHGGLMPSERRALVDGFTRGRIDLLIATDAAGEGLNLHPRCRLVVNNDLPWNPLRLEQRVGRVDRLGQARRVHALHLCLGGSIEDTVLARIDQRRRRADAGLRHARSRWTSDVALAATALGGLPLDEAALPETDPDEVPRAQNEAARLRAQRAARARPTRRPPDGPVWAPARRIRGTRSAVVIYCVRHVDDGGRLLATSAHPVEVDLRSPPPDRRAWHRIVVRLASDPGVRAVIERLAEADAAAVARALAPLHGAARRRLARIEALLGARGSALVQASLFDGRAERLHRARRDVVVQWREHLARLSARLIDDGPGRVRSCLDLVAIWPGRR